jgi:hypothetical protein
VTSSVTISTRSASTEPDIPDALADDPAFNHVALGAWRRIAKAGPTPLRDIIRAVEDLTAAGWLGETHDGEYYARTAPRGEYYARTAPRPVTR